MRHAFAILRRAHEREKVEYFLACKWQAMVVHSSHTGPPISLGSVRTLTTMPRGSNDPGWSGIGSNVFRCEHVGNILHTMYADWFLMMWSIMLFKTWSDVTNHRTDTVRVCTTMTNTIFIVGLVGGNYVDTWAARKYSTRHLMDKLPKYKCVLRMLYASS